MADLDLRRHEQAIRDNMLAPIEPFTEHNVLQRMVDNINLNRPNPFTIHILDTQFYVDINDTEYMNSIKDDPSCLNASLIFLDCTIFECIRDDILETYRNLIYEGFDDNRSINLSYPVYDKLNKEIQKLSSSKNLRELFLFWFADITAVECGEYVLGSNATIVEDADNDECLNVQLNFDLYTCLHNWLIANVV